MTTAKSETAFESYAEVVMKLSSAVNLRSESVSIEMVHESVKIILKSAFDKASSTGKINQLDNTLFVYMGLVKVSSLLLKVAQFMLFISMTN